MTNGEIRSTYEELADILTESGLGWVVDQVEQTVRAGKQVEVPTRIFKEVDETDEFATMFGEQLSTRRGGKPTVMMTLQPWPDADRLMFLIKGVREAIVNATQVENDQLRRLRTVANVEAIVFETDGEPSDRLPLRLTGAGGEVAAVIPEPEFEPGNPGALRLLAAKDEPTQMLSNLLDELQREASA